MKAKKGLNSLQKSPSQSKYLSFGEQFDQSTQQWPTYHESGKGYKAQEMLQKIIQLQDPLTGSRLIDRFNILDLVKILDKNKLQTIDKIYNLKPEGFNLLEFIRFFLNAIEHFESETLYLTIGLVDLFKAIAQTNNSIERIKFIHLTDFICNTILNSQDSNSITGVSNTYSENKIDMKLVPEHKYVSPNYQIKPYIIDPPIIYGNKQELIYKLSQNNIKTDKNKHDSVVTCSYYSNTYKKVFSLDALAQAISIYDINCKLQKKLKPQNLKIKKDVVLLSFAYSERQQRIGAVLKDFTLSFWDFNDNLEFQKVISTASSCQQYQTNIWYLEYFQAWITSDKTGIIYIWNLQKQIPERKIQCKFRGKINDVCEIPGLNILAVSQQSRGNRISSISMNKDAEEPKIILYDYFRGEEVGQISAMTDMRIPHTLQYSQNYQVLLSVGFEKKINIFEINHHYLDTNLKGQLMGHENLITNFVLVKKTPMVVSCDDKGKVKIWDLRSYKCIQTLDFRDKTVITRLLDMVEIGKLGVLGSRINFLQYDQKQQIIKKYQQHQKNTPLNINFIYESNKLLVTTKKDLRVYSLFNGSIQNVYCEYHTKDEQIVILKYYELMKKLLITNDRGEIRLISLGNGLMSVRSGEGNEQTDNKECYEQKLQGYSNGIVTHVEYDQENKLFLTCGGNGTINIHKLIINNNNIIKSEDFYDNGLEQKASILKKLSSTKFSTGNNKKSSSQHKIGVKQFKPAKNQQWMVIRQMKGNFFNKDITTMAFSVYHGMIAIGSNCNEVYVWDYEYAKILFIIELQKGLQPTAMSFINSYSILLIATSNGELYFLKLQRPTEYQPQEKSTHTPKNISSEHIFTFKDNRQITKNSLSQSSKLNKEQDPNDYITQILVDISMKGTHKKLQTIEFAKIYLAYSSGKIAIISLSSVLKKHPIVPHRKTIATYNPERQLKEQFAVQLQKQKTPRIILIPLEENDVTKRQSHFPYEFLKPHSGTINSMKILQFDKHYLVTCGNDERIKIWDDVQLQSKLNQKNLSNNNNQNHNRISRIQLLGDFNVNHPLPYLWNFVVKDENKMRDKIMFSLKIIQSIFKKFGSDISSGESKILKLEKFFKFLTKIGNNSNNFSENQEQTNFLTQPQNYITLQKIKQKDFKQAKTKKAYLFQEQFSKKDLHYDEIKKYNFYEVGGPSLRELQFRKKIDTIQKQWQLAKEKQEDQKNELMAKIQLKAQKNEQKQQIIAFLQDKRLLKNTNRTSNTTLMNCNTGNNNNVTTREEDNQFLAVKRITEELKRVQSQQQLLGSNSNGFLMNNCRKGHNHSSTFIGKFTNSSGTLNKLNNSITDLNFNKPNEQKSQNYNNLLKNYYTKTKPSNLVNGKSVNPKRFQEYYSKKVSSKANLESEAGQRVQTVPTFQSKYNTSFSLMNSRSFSQQSFLRKDNYANKSKLNEHLSFQNILKDMNNRVLLSRQGRNIGLTRDTPSQQNQTSQKQKNSAHEREKRTKRLAKTQYSSKQFNEDKIN